MILEDRGMPTRAVTADRHREKFWALADAEMDLENLGSRNSILRLSRKNWINIEILTYYPKHLLINQILNVFQIRFYYFNAKFCCGQVFLARNFNFIVYLFLMGVNGKLHRQKSSYGDVISAADNFFDHCDARTTKKSMERKKDYVEK